MQDIRDQSRVRVLTDELTALRNEHDALCSATVDLLISTVMRSGHTTQWVTARECVQRYIQGVKDGARI